MGSSGIDSLFNHNITPFDNPKLELGCNMVDTFTKVGESIEDFYKENPPNNKYSNCQKCGKKFRPKDIYEKICIKCSNEELIERIRKNNFYGCGIKYCQICNRSFIPMNKSQLYCYDCKICLKCGKLIPPNESNVFCSQCKYLYLDYLKKKNNNANKNPLDSGTSNSRPYYYPNSYYESDELDNPGSNII